MPWPLPSHFSAMLQTPRVAFRDAALRACQIEKNQQNQPRCWAGQFAVVYKATWTDGRAPKAVRTFSSQSPERRERYALLGAYVQDRRLRCLVPFEYRDDAIRSSGDGAWYPLIVMDWVEGHTLWAYARARCLAGKSASLAKLARNWVGLVEELAETRIAHGDLQHANVMVTPAGLLRLVDYDGMCVPALVGRPNLELGVEPYQHPGRNGQTLLSPALDRFSTIMIYVTLRALAAEPTLWQRYVEDSRYDKLLFRLEDMLDPQASPLQQDLQRSPDAELPRLAAMLCAAAAGPMDQVPSLSDVIHAARLRPDVASVAPETAQGSSGGPRSAAGFPLPQADRDAPIPAPATDAASGQRGSVTLAVVSGPLEGRQFVLDRHDTFIFGRHSDCHARLNGDPRVSRHHFLLEVNPPVARLRDLGSRNGTYINGTKHGGRAEEIPQGQYQFPQVDLHDGDTVVVGRTRIRVTIRGRAAPQPGLWVCQRCQSSIEPDAGVLVGELFFCAACRAAVEEVAQGQAQKIEGVVDFSGPAPAPSASGRLTDYRLGPELGKGPMGTVYRAVHKADHTEVAVKVAELKITADREERSQFLEQIGRLRDLRHANIVSLLEYGTHHKDFYFVSEFCAGGNLEQRLQTFGGLLPWAEAGPIFVQCLEGLEHAHRQGFVHGDLKPENILFGPRSGHQVVQLSDYGVTARFEKAGFAGLTATGMAQREYQFMPREQLTGYRDSHPASDLWRLAAVFYYCVTGRPSRDLEQRDPIVVVLNEECVPLASRNRKIPAPIAAVIDQALRSEPQARYPSATAMKTALLQAYGQAGKAL